jgi:hypothetical protein
LWGSFFLDKNTGWAVGEQGSMINYLDNLTIPSAPNYLIASALSGKVNLSWTDNAIDETGFEIFRSDGYSGNYKKIATVNQNTISYQDNNVSAPVTYWYRVRAVNSTGSSALCREDSATTILPLPSIPTLVSPLNNSMSQPISLNLTWNASNDADTYQCQVATDFQFNNIIVDDSTLSSTSKSIYGLTNNILYYWKVRAKNISGYSQWSEIWNFTTINLPPPSKPALYEPINGAKDQGPYIFMSWEYFSGSSYRLQIAKDINFISMVYDSSNISNSAISLSQFEYSTTFYWHVGATNSGGTGPWSDTWSFSTLDMIPMMPTLSNPPNGSINEPVNTILRWSKSQYAAQYHLQISSNLSMVPVYFESDQLEDTFYQCNLQNGVIYYWRVRSLNDTYNSSWTFT